MNIEILDPALNTTKQMSARYVQMDTRQIVNAILQQKDNEGNDRFELRSIDRKHGKKQGRGIHLVRIKTVKSYKLNGDDVHPEIIIKNSYDGSCPLECHIGIFRIACTNGLIVTAKDGDFGQVKIRHMGTPQEMAFQIVEQFAGKLREVVETQRKIGKTILSDEQMIDFALKAAALRWDKTFSVEDTEKLLEVARPEDEGSNLWVVMNRVQEKLINGGIKPSFSKKTSRQITNIQANMEINSKLLELAMEYAN